MPSVFLGPFVITTLGFVLFGSHLWFLTHPAQVWELFALPYIMLPFRAWESFFLLLPFFPLLPELRGVYHRAGWVSVSSWCGYWKPHLPAKSFWLWAKWRVGICHSFAAVELKECCMACWKLLSGLEWGVYGVCVEGWGSCSLCRRHGILPGAIC